MGYSVLISNASKIDRRNNVLIKTENAGNLEVHLDEIDQFNDGLSVKPTSLVL